MLDWCLRGVFNSCRLMSADWLNSVATHKLLLCGVWLTTLKWKLILFMSSTISICISSIKLSVRNTGQCLVFACAADPRIVKIKELHPIVLTQLVNWSVIIRATCFVKLKIWIGYYFDLLLFHSIMSLLLLLLESISYHFQFRLNLINLRLESLFSIFHGLSLNFLSLYLFNFP